MKQVILVVLILISNTVLLKAQDVQNTLLSYGDELRATLPIDSLESEFHFEGKAGDIIIVEASIRIDDILSAFHPKISLLNERGTPVAESLDETFQYIGVLPFELPTDGTYTLLITPGEYSYVESNAPFSLRLLRPKILEPNVAVNDTLTGEVPVYYIVVSDDTFSIDVSRIDGAFSPTMAIARIQAGMFEVLGLLLGQGVVNGSITIEPNRNPLHFVELSKPTYEHTIVPIEGRVTFEITLSH